MQNKKSMEINRRIAAFMERDVYKGKENPYETVRSGEACLIGDADSGSTGRTPIRKSCYGEENGMWYVIQVRTGAEESVRRQCGNIFNKDVMEHCFIPRYEEKKKYQGSWHVRQRALFPGYVFIVSGRLELLFEGLKKVSGLTKLIGTGKEIVPLKEEEIELLKKIGADEKAVGISTGVIENGTVTITEGPLKGMEGCIRKIDRHKRKVWLQIEMFGRITEMEAGLEIIMKE